MQITAVAESPENLGKPALVETVAKALGSSAAPGSVSPSGADGASEHAGLEGLRAERFKAMMAVGKDAAPADSASISALFSSKASEGGGLADTFASSIKRLTDSMSRINASDEDGGSMSLISAIGVQHDVAYSSLTVDFVSKIVGKLLSAVDTLMKQG